MDLSLHRNLHEPAGGRALAPRARLPVVFLLSTLLLWGISAQSAPLPTLIEIRDLNRSGRSQEAETAARDLLARLEAGASADSLAMAETLDELSVALRRGGKAGRQEAEDFCRRAATLKERMLGAKDPRYATSLYHWGMLWFARKDAPRAIPLLQQSVDIRVEALGDAHNDVAVSLIAMGAAYSELGRDSLAADVIERAVEVQRRALGPGHPDLVRGLNALGSALYRMGQFSRAIPIYEESLRLTEASPEPNRAILGETLHNLGCLFSETGEVERAQAMLQRALKVRRGAHGPDHPLVASTLVALGESYYDARAFRTARTRYVEALKIQRAEQAAPPDVAWTLMKMGWASLALNRMAEASAELTEAMTLQESILGERHPALWLTLVGLAEVERWNQRNERSKQYFERAIAILHDAYGPYFLDLGPTRDRYARFLLEIADSSAALDCSLAGAEVNRIQLRLTSRGLAERQALTYASALMSAPDVALSVLAGQRYRSDPALIARVWDSLIRSRALVLDEIGSRQRLAWELGSEAPSADRLRMARRRLAALLVQGPAQRDGYRALVDSARTEVEAAERDLAATSASFRSGQAQDTVGWKDVLAAVPSKSALVAFARYGQGPESAYIALVLGADRSVSVRRIGRATAIHRSIGRWRHSLVTALDASGRPRPGGERECRAAGDEVRRTIWDSITADLEGADRVFIVPEGALHLVSFAALPVGRSSYLVERGPVLHLLSAERELIRRATPEDAGKGILAIGGPSFERLPRSSRDPTRFQDATPAASSSGCDSFRSHEFAPLPGSGDEVKEIARIWAGRSEAVLLTGERATERAVKTMSPGKEVVHIASHGFFFKDRCEVRASEVGTRGIGGVVSPTIRPSLRPPIENPMLLSGIALAGANRRSLAGPGEEDGILTAEEIASMDLSGVAWVVLSACDTGLGEIQSGEGVLGLRRAFQLAGAGTLVMSLWSVEDQSAREWMGELYRYRVRDGRLTADAVHEASRHRLQARRAEGRGTHPYFWAGFVAAGAWQ